MNPQTRRRIVAASGALIVLVVVIGAVTVYAGAYDVAATGRHGGLTEWALGTVMERSVQTRAEAVGEPIAVDSAALDHGFVHFDAMCVDCHGAPGVERGEIGQGLNPEPPDLSDAVSEWSDRELFWITRHGIRMTGMPGFGPTHTDEDLWAIVAVVRRLDEMSADAYAAAVAAAGSEHTHDDGAAGEHTHPPGTPEHEH